MPQLPPARTTSKQGSTSLVLVLLAFVLQVVYLPAHLVLEEHHSALGDCVRKQQQHEDVEWHNHGDGWHWHGDGTADHEHVGGHEHNPEHDHGCQFFVFRQQLLQVRISEPWDVPQLHGSIELSHATQWTTRSQEAQQPLFAAMQRVHGSRGPPARV